MDRTIAAWDLAPLCSRERDAPTRSTLDCERVAWSERCREECPSWRDCSDRSDHEQKPLLVLCEHTDFVRAVQFDHERIISSSDDGQVLITLLGRPPRVALAAKLLGGSGSGSAPSGSGSGSGSGVAEDGAASPTPVSGVDTPRRSRW